MKVEYSSNNSGGHWWLKDKDWQKLEDAGWVVMWGGMEFYDEDSPNYGKRRAQSLKEVIESNLYYVGAVARCATLDEVSSVREAISQWESILGMSSQEEGCYCCGKPHCFSEAYVKR